MSYKEELAAMQDRQLFGLIESGDLSKRHLRELGYDPNGSRHNVEMRQKNKRKAVDIPKRRKLVRKVLGE